MFTVCMADEAAEVSNKENLIFERSFLHGFCHCGEETTVIKELISNSVRDHAFSMDNCGGHNLMMVLGTWLAGTLVH